MATFPESEDHTNLQLDAFQSLVNGFLQEMPGSTLRRIKVRSIPLTEIPESVRKILRLRYRDIEHGRSNLFSLTITHAHLRFRQEHPSAADNYEVRGLTLHLENDYDAAVKRGEWEIPKRDSTLISAVDSSQLTDMDQFLKETWAKMRYRKSA